jgi:hypothetical protein
MQSYINCGNKSAEEVTLVKKLYNRPDYVLKTRLASIFIETELLVTVDDVSSI